jgi:perosamine synthetase
MIPIYKPYFTVDSLRFVHDAIDSEWVSSTGEYINKTQDKLKDLLGVRNVLLTNNGTSATHLAALCLKYRYNNIYKIIAPNNVYVAAWNSFLFDKNYILNIIDANLGTWNFDINNIDIIDSNTALLVVHNIGNIINVPSIKRRHPNLITIEDNCEGFCGSYENKYSGTQSLVSSISFFGNKNITSGEGGAIITNDDDLFEYAKCVHGQGMSDKKFIHNHLGYNYRMTNIAAAILFGQLSILSEIIDKKEKIFDMYRKSFDNIENIKYQKIEGGTQHSNWMFGVRVLGNVGYDVAKCFFDAKQIETRPMFYPISSHRHLANNPSVIIKDETNAHILNKECIILPSHPGLGIDQINYIINAVLEYTKLTIIYNSKSSNNGAI